MLREHSKSTLELKQNKTGIPAGRMYRGCPDQISMVGRYDKGYKAFNDSFMLDESI